MFTLLNGDHTLATGLFKTREDAIEWHQRFVPEVHMTPVELMLNEDHKADLLAQGHMTWESDDTWMSDMPIAGGVH